MAAATHMGLTLPKLMSVLSHELRGPLTVMQGYARMMIRSRDESHAETAMLRAMLVATAKLVQLGEQATEIGRWSETRPPAPTEAIPLGSLLDQAITAVPAASASARLPERERAMLVQTTDVAALVAALSALITAAARESPGTPIDVTVPVGRDNADPDLILLIGPPPRTRQDAGGPSESQDAPSRRAMTFDRGGLGMTLALASYVLEAHGARVTEIGAPGVIEVRLPNNQHE